MPYKILKVLFLCYNNFGDVMNVDTINVLVLAYLGDNVYEYYVRKHLINSKIATVNELQTTAVNYVSANNQAKFLQKLTDDNFFTEEELKVIKRARNHKNISHPKNCDAITYKYATGLEALLGYLELLNRKERIEEIMNKILGGNKC